MGKSSIEWCTDVWNPVTGCTKVSPGCAHCYAERLFPRAYGKDRKFTDVRCHPERLEQPLHWKKPRRIFVNSMSDLFHEAVPTEFIQHVFDVMHAADWHIFQILTKRPERMYPVLFGEEGGWYLGSGDYYRNVQLGVSVENQPRADERISKLLALGWYGVNFVSYEPALAPVDFTQISVGRTVAIDSLRGGTLFGEDGAYDYSKVDWVIVGGESGPGARAFDIAWPRSTIAQCKAAGVPVFVKQLGSNIIETLGICTLCRGLYPESCHVCAGSGQNVRIWDLRDRKGGDWSEWPEDLQVREFPELV